MYSGTTLNNKSGFILGAHQKIDKVSRKNLNLLTSNSSKFPSTKEILHFEGKNGPDGIKRKSPAKDEPWHYYDPFDDADVQLIEIVDQHYRDLVIKLRKGEPAAFDAAWLAHGLVDGLTPAHHFPYEAKLEELRGGSIDQRTSIAKKLIIPGDNTMQTLKNNWKMWGVGGLMSMHGMFEIGVGAILAPLKMNSSLPSENDIKQMIDLGWVEYFQRSAREIALLDMYDRFYARGWTVKLIRDVRNELGPIIIKTVTLTWFLAMREAGVLVTKK